MLKPLIVPLKYIKSLFFENGFNLSSNDILALSTFKVCGQKIDICMEMFANSKMLFVEMASAIGKQKM